MTEIQKLQKQLDRCRGRQVKLNQIYERKVIELRERLDRNLGPLFQEDSIICQRLSILRHAEKEKQP